MKCEIEDDAFAALASCWSCLGLFWQNEEYNTQVKM